MSWDGSRSGFPLREIPHERQVAAAGHDQEDRQVHQGEAGREARQGITTETLSPTRSTRRRRSDAPVAGRRSGPRPRRTSSACRSTPSTSRTSMRTSASGSPSSTGTASASAPPTSRSPPYVAGFASRDELLADSDVVLLPKPQHSDIAALGPGQVLWGWPHCVQDTELTQMAIDQQLTLIAFEAMNHWTGDGAVGPARLPQEQRARRLLLGAPGDGAGRDHRRLRAPARPPS